MSQENVEIVRRALESFVGRPKPDFATVSHLFHPDHEYISRMDIFEGGVHRGGRGFRDWLVAAEDVVEWEQRLERVTEIDDDRVLAIVPTRFKGKSSGVTLNEERMGLVVTVRGGKIIRSEFYRSPDEALKAVGREE